MIGSAIRDLTGTWSVDDLARVMDGFSHGRLVQCLSAATTGVNCALTLSDGRALQLVGAVLPDGSVQGLLLSDLPVETNAHEEPGPALKPVFQPILDLSAGHWVGFEALARWTTPDDRQHFGRALDDEGLASNMLIRSVDALSGWHTASGNTSWFVQVNLTGRDLEQDGLPDLLAALIDGFGLPKNTLRIELTEQAALRDSQRSIDMAKQIKAVGAGLVLDDFGSGHSSFSWLAQLPVDSLKIDPDLTRNIAEPRTRAILKSVTNLARDLGMTSTAEGIETPLQLEAAIETGFDYAQGYVISHPLAEADARDAVCKSGTAGSGLQAT